MADGLGEQVLDAPVPEKEKSGGFDFNAIIQSPAFIPGVALLLGFIALFWDMMRFLPDLWLSEDGYYSHGFLVPLISGYIVYRNWSNIKDRPVKPFYWGIPIILFGLYVARVLASTNIYTFAAGTVMVMMLGSVLVIAGWEWLKALFWPIVYLGFALPFFQRFIEISTNPLQSLSTDVAYNLLKILGFDPYRDSGDTINLAKFTLNIAIPCSGLKLLLALGAFTMFFILVAKLKFWNNVIMVVLWPVLAIFINGLRIALIGIVGNLWPDGLLNTNNHDAAMKFHDWSGYITLIICFFILFKIARGLGWKD